MNTYKERVNEILKMRLYTSPILIILWLAIYYFEYQFTNYLLNGIILHLTSVLVFLTIRIEKYYYLTGFTDADKEHKDTYDDFNFLHPKIAIYNSILLLLFILANIVAFVMICLWIVSLLSN